MFSLFGSFVVGSFMIGSLICEKVRNESVHDPTNEERVRVLRILHRLKSGGRIQVPVGDLRNWSQDRETVQNVDARFPPLMS